MNTSNNVQITVTKIINAPGRGVLASGHIEGGIIHLGDVLQVHNHHPGATARVGQISLGNKMVKEARTGDNALLLLENLTEEAVHLGDQLLPGDEKDIPQKDIPKTDEESWEKLPERIQPILHFRQLIGKIAMLAFLGIFLIVPIFMLIPLLDSIMSTGIGGNHLLFLAFFLVWYGIVGFVVYTQVKGLVQGLQGRNRFQQGQSQTIAQILRRRVVEHEGKYDSTYTFHIQMEFTPTLAMVSAGVMRLEVSISKKLYEALWGRDSVNVTYAVEDPRIFVLEGE